MNISTAVGYVLAFVVDPLYGLPTGLETMTQVGRFLLGTSFSSEQGRLSTLGGINSTQMTVEASQ